MKIDFVIIVISILVLFGIGVRMQSEAEIQDIYKSSQHTITMQQIEITALTRSIKYLETKRKIVYPYLCPIHVDDYKRLSSPFGLRKVPSGIYTGGSLTREHLGIDLVGTKWARVVPVAAGKVLEKWYVPDGKQRVGHPLMGGYVKIKHNDGYISGYGHLSAIYVKEGDTIKIGDILGRVGSTGDSTGPHLHFSLQDQTGKYLQPLNYIDIED